MLFSPRKQWHCVITLGNLIHDWINAAALKGGVATFFSLLVLLGCRVHLFCIVVDSSYSKGIKASCQKGLFYNQLYIEPDIDWDEWPKVI